MKKKFIVALVAFFVFGLANVGAMSESELQNKLTKTYTINGVTYQATAAQKKDIERYLANNDVTESDADYIAGQIDNIVAIVKESGVTDLNKLSKSYKNQITGILNDVANKTGIKVTLKNGTIAVYNKNSNELAFEYSVDSDNTGIIKRTGSASVLYIAAATSLIGALYFANKVKKANN